MAELRAAIDTAVPPQRLWATVTDWPGQSRWIPLTKARRVSDLDGVGAEVEAWTGVGPVGFLDTMVVEVWEPPSRLVLLHTGKVVRGRAGFEIAAAGAGSRLTWWEDVDPPFGVVGRRLWPLGVPAARLVLKWCLRRVAKVAGE